MCRCCAVLLLGLVVVLLAVLVYNIIFANLFYFKAISVVAQPLEQIAKVLSHSYN